MGKLRADYNEKAVAKSMGAPEILKPYRASQIAMLGRIGTRWRRGTEFRVRLRTLNRFREQSKGKTAEGHDF